MSRETNYAHCYQTLDLKPGASLAEIKHRYRELARRWHPDTVHPDQRAQATLRFQQINQAKDALESYWETHHRAPISAVQQRFQEAVLRRGAEQARQSSASMYAQRESFYSAYQQHDQETNWQHAKEEHSTPQSAQALSSSLRIFDRLLITIIAEATIFLILWVGYFVLSNVHADLLVLHAQAKHDLMLKLSYGFLDLVLVSGGYLASVALLLLALLFLCFPHNTIQEMFSSRRKRPDNPFPYFSHPYSSRHRW
jgi:hypothetical protein